MLWYKLKLSIRSLANDKLNSIINIFGLAVGMAAVILISIFIQYEFSYDKFNSKHEQIYRLITQIGMDNLTDYSINTRINVEEFSDKIPGLEEVSQLYRGWDCEIIRNGERFFNFEFQLVDDNFNKVFDLEFLRGNPNTAFKNPNSIVLNEKTANTIFGTIDILGEQVSLNGIDCSISGVTKNLPTNSHYGFELLAPLKSMYSLQAETGLEFFTYLLIKENSNPENTLNNIKNEYLKELSHFESRGYKIDAYFQKLDNIHLHSEHLISLKSNGSIDTVIIHLFLAILILVIAIINFVNIITIQYESRIKEIGLKKAIGASQFELISQFVGKSLLLSFFSVIIGTIIAEIFLPHFRNLVHRHLVIDYANNLLLVIGIPLLALIVGLVSGIYPALLISKPSPAIALRGGILKINGKNILTKVLVVFQFTISIILFASLFILNQQIFFLKHTDLGFNPEKVVAITNINAKLNQSYYAIKQELIKNPFIQYVSASDHYPGGGCSGQAFTIVGKDESLDKSFDSYRIQPDYFKTVGITLLKGKIFSETNTFHQKGIIVNETGAKFLNEKDVIGLNVLYKEENQEIIGIVKDFNYESLHSKIQPLMFTHNSYSMLSDILIRYQGADLKPLLSEITTIFRKFDPGYVLGYTLIDDFCHNRYQREEKSFQLMGYTSILSLILALLGMYVLSLFMVKKRTKEIGIRKVTGASEWQITSLLFSTFIKWLAIAFVIAIPISYFIMQNWLEQFAYHISITPLPFVLAGLITALFALLVVGGQTWKAAKQNPVDSLRSE